MPVGPALPNGVRTPSTKTTSRSWRGRRSPDDTGPPRWVQAPVPGGGSAAVKLPAGNRGSKEVSPRPGEAVTSADPRCAVGHETVTGEGFACGHNPGRRTITRGLLNIPDRSDSPDGATAHPHDGTGSDPRARRGGV